MIRRNLAAATVLAALSGCGAHNVVVMDGLKAPERSFVEDRTQPDNYPSLMSGEGNVYSCRYGIHHQAAAEYNPPKAQVFAALLARETPGIEQRKVVLHRFDVYRNARLANLSAAGQVTGGSVGRAMDDYAKGVGAGVYSAEKLIVDTKPGTPRHPNEKMVGCDNAGEGEYYVSEISGGHNVVVTWLRFDVDGASYHLRTFYQFQPNSLADNQAAIRDAIQRSIKAAAATIK